MAKSPSAIILHWAHEYGAVEGPAVALAKGFSALGVEVSLLDAGSKAAVLAASPRAADYDLAVSVGTPPLRRSLLGLPLYRFFGRKFLVWILDPIIHDLNRVSAVRAFCEAARTSSRLGLLFPDTSYAELARALAGPAAPRAFPFGGFYEASAPDEAPRERRIAVFGTIGSELAEAGDETLEETIASRDPFGLSAGRRRDLAEAVQAAEAPGNVAIVLGRNLDLDPERLLAQDALPLVTAVDAFEKRRRRLAVVKSLRDLPIDFHGKGWERRVEEGPHRRMMGSVPFSEIGSRMRRYRLVLNFDPNWDGGLHDRVYTALGNGCRVLTNVSDALHDLDLDGIFGNAHALHAYRPNAPDPYDAARAMLDLPPLAASACLKFRALNSWFARADAFLAAEGIVRGSPRKE